MGMTIDLLDVATDIVISGAQEVGDRLNRLLVLEQQLNIITAPPADGAEHTGHTPRTSELALMKGFHRRTWTGPAWIEAVTEAGQVHAMPKVLLFHNKECLAGH